MLARSARVLPRPLLPSGASRRLVRSPLPYGRGSVPSVRNIRLWAKQTAWPGICSDPLLPQHRQFGGKVPRQAPHVRETTRSAGWRRSASSSGMPTTTLPAPESLWIRSSMRFAAANLLRRSARTSNSFAWKRSTARLRTTWQTRMSSMRTWSAKAKDGPKEGATPSRCQLIRTAQVVEVRLTSSWRSTITPSLSSTYVFFLAGAAEHIEYRTPGAKWRGRPAFSNPAKKIRPTSAPAATG